MNYHEAELMIETYNHLVDKTFKGKAISKLIIAPAKHEEIARLMYNLANDISSKPIYQKYSDFDVVVIFDFDDWLTTGVLHKKSLTLALPDILEAV